MYNTHRILPTYTGDVSGAAGALYELGGMTVIHDPSGCNSTYNTHDETRWYDRESLIYISGLSEVDAILGNDEKLIADICNAAELMRPSFIALTNSPIPWLNGTDFTGLARLLEHRTGLPVFYVPTNGSHDYSVGAGEAFLALGKKLLAGSIGEEVPLGASPSSVSASQDHIKINLLGVTPLDFDAPGTVQSLYAQLEEFAILSCWAMGSSMQDLKNAPLADVNLVVSVTGYMLAQWMQEQFGIPYVCGVPVGSRKEAVAGAAREAVEMRKKGGQFRETLHGRNESVQSQNVLPGEDESGQPTSASILLIGEPVLMHSLAAHLQQETGEKPLIVCPLEEDAGLADVRTRGEEDLEALLRRIRPDYVIADPFYRCILPEETKLIGLSHQAFSGRSFRSERLNLMDPKMLRKFRQMCQ